ncbi:MAG: adenylate/guanylate cyclase domain-containing protein [Coleofasciculus sp. D1-CHI-01]|uniref:adenylate/guanylate cyclase domain-containing protein n=1 Tax=Coleofasciculus sp. D1-CHI-01 TaxID=3068482 RepID=UPI00330251A7
MSSQWLNLLRLFQSRLSQQITLWVFISLIFIESLILIPSYYRRKHELLGQLEDVSGEVVESVVRLTQQNMSPIVFGEEVVKLTRGSQVILGVAIYQENGQPMGIFGESPTLSFQDIQQSDLPHVRKLQGQRYDVAWSAEKLGKPYIIIIRHDASSIQPQLYAFILRIAGLVLLISLFVTGTTMLVLGKTVIVPILKLRQDLINAGEAISHNQLNPNFYALSVQRHDELGDVMTAFNQMFQRITWEISERQRTAEKLRVEQEKSERLLLNILPETIAERLKQNPICIADGFTDVTILFADIVGFAKLSERISPTELVNLLNEIFSAFDHLTEKHNLEKIKTIGDAYMVASGLPTPRPDHAAVIAEMALDMQQEIQQFNTMHNTDLSIRIGINTGAVVAGVIGTKKFIYDLWGDAVNTASRMESHGLPDSIQVTTATYQHLHDNYEFQERGIIPVKGKGKMMTYFLTRKKDPDI